MSRDYIWDVGVSTGSCGQDDMQTILDKCTVNLNDYDRDYIITLYKANMNRYLLEYIYKITLRTLRKPLMDLGERLIKAMCYVTNKSGMTDVPDIYLLGLATKFELINKQEQLKIVELIELLQIQNYYNSASSITKEQADHYIKSCFDAVLFKDYTAFETSFKNIVKKLSDETLLPLSYEYVAIVNATRHEKIVVARLLCELLFNYKGDNENDPLINNFKLLMPPLWESITTSDKLFFAYYYKSLSKDTIQKKAFGEVAALSTIRFPDFNTELDTVAKIFKGGQDVISCHYSINNRREETSELLSLKQYVYTPAVFSRCIITPALIGYMGNSYGYMKESRLNAEYILDNISHEKWVYYFKNYFFSDSNILLKLVFSDTCRERWVEIITRFVDKDIEFDSKTEKLIECTRKGDLDQIYNICSETYFGRTQINKDI